MSISQDEIWVKCDFCETKILKEDVRIDGHGWEWAQRGWVIPMGNVCAMDREIKHSCPNDLCKAKLLVWARS